MPARRPAVAERSSPRLLTWLAEHEIKDGALASLPFLIVTLPLLTFVPIWDGRIYAECVRKAATSSPALGNFICAEHPTVVFIGWLAALTAFSPDSAVPIALGSILLGIAGIFAFHRVARALAPEPERRLEIVLLAAAAGLTPQVVASVAHPSPDFGVWAFALLVLMALLQERLWLVAIFGVGAVLSKESGLLVYLLFVASYVVAFVTRVEANRRARLLRLWPLVIPVVMYWLVGQLRPPAPPSPVATVDVSVLRQFLTFSMLDNMWPAALACVFVLGFAWLPTGVIVWRGAVRAWRWAFGKPSDPVSPRDGFILACFVLLALALTRYRTYLNVRYFLPVAPLLLLVAWRLLGVQKAKVRAGIIAAFAVLQLVSVYRSIDPLSRAIFGTFDFGDKAILHMTSLTGECCGKGRDQIAYNLQFIELGRLSEVAYQDLAKAGLPIASDSLADWYLLGTVEPGTLKRTLAPSGINAGLLTLRHLQRNPNLPAEVWFLSYPNFPDTELDQWKRAYDDVETRRFESGGYVLIAHHLRRR